MLGSEMLAEVAVDLAGKGSFDHRMNTALGHIGRHLKVSRAYVFLDRPGGTFTDNTHEWCAPGIAPQIKNLQGVDYRLIPAWRGQLEQDGRILASDISKLAAGIRVVLEPQGIKSLLVLPLYVRSQMIGFIGFDDCIANRGWDIEELSVLRTVAGIVSVILERDRDRLQLEASEKNFRQFFETIEHMILIATPAGRIVYANPAVNQVLGYTADDLEAMNLIDLHPEDRREEARQIVDEMLQRKRDVCPLELTRKDGVRIPVETRVWINQWNGETCLFGISKDLSVEQARLQLYTRLFNESPVPMALSDIKDNTLTDVNVAFLEKLGYDRSEVIGRSTIELGLYADPEQRRRLGEQLAQDGRIQNVEVTVRRKDGKQLEGLFSGGLLNNQGEKRLLTVMIDISEQVELRKHLDTQRRRLRNIIESTKMGTWEWDIGTGKTIFNDRWAAMLGYTLAELEPTTLETWKKLTLPEDLKTSETLLAAHFAGKTDYYEFEGRMRHKDGRLIRILDRGKVIEWNPDGSPLRMFGTHQEITDRGIT